MSAAYPLPYTYARQHGVLLHIDRGESWLYVRHASDDERVARWSAIGEVRRRHGPCRLQWEEADAFERRLQTAYADGSGDSAAAIVSEVQSDADLSRLMQELPRIEDLLESADDAPIIRMLNALLAQAVREHASDVHIEPYERHSSVRFRIDGVLREVVQPNRALHAALISRLKIMAELDIAEKRLPQDGRIGLRLGGRAVDVRVSTLPSAHGERAVLRLLDKSDGVLSLEAVGMQGETLQRFERLIQQPHGIVLVTGPTGSGKTTTLYAALSRLDAQHLNIMTVEDPIEYELPGIGQTQVNPKIDLTFAAALRAILRQDPDVIMICAVTRLVDMGVEPFLLSSSLLGVLAQRLVRRLCAHCRGAGCEACNRSGYAGRTGIFELLVVDDALRARIHERAPEAALREHALAHGMVPLRQAGDALVAQGVTSAEEVWRATRD